MQNPYDPSSVEPKWQQRWAEANVYDFDIHKAKDPFYLMVMFPYPSGAQLHVGHWFQYSIPDSYGRFMKMKGKDVFHPLGFDAFGLPAENYAIKTGVPPAESTQNNVDAMIGQFNRMGVMFDWKYSVNTSKPEYYRWTQWLFLQMYKNKLAYKKEANVNWCPKDQTVLANEQVKDGCCERCGTEVVQKSLNQWFWQTTKYAQKLLDNLEDLDWPAKTKTMQRNWIGRKEGINLTYAVKGCDEMITCFTTRPDTNFGATFLVIAPEHPFAQKIASGELASDHQQEVVKYINEATNKKEIERQAEGRKKTGAFTGFVAINTLNNKELPIWISDFVLGHFGTGAVIGVPGHDLRDFEFASTFDLPIVRVVVASDGDTSPITRVEQVQEEEGTMINSGFADGLPIMEAMERIKDYSVEKGWGERIVSYRLRDWTISRQRYWGAPIPVVYDPEGTAHPIPEEHLPWLLPTDVEFKPTGESPLTHSKEFIERTEKIFGKGWTPEFDTMDTFVCSSFYYLRYLAEGNEKQIVDPSIEKEWMPVDMYIGGPEHATMHLIYARFVMMALKDMGYVSHDEPFQRLVHQGLITNQGAKMSKSKGNVVSPDGFVDRYGSDVFRMYLMFMGPFTDGGDWSDTGIKGIDRFVQKVYKLLSEPSDKKDDASVIHAIHNATKRVTEAIEKLQFNIAISALMECFNTIDDAKGCSIDTAKTFITLLSPLAPHLAEELWEKLGQKGMVVEQTWPNYDPALLVKDTLTIAVQINGKLRGTVEVSSAASKEDIITAAKEEENVKKYFEGATIKKEIYVPGKLVSFVI